MSRFLMQRSKLAHLIQKKGFRLFSSSLTGPFLRIGQRMKDDGSIGEDVFLNAAKEELFYLPKKPLPQKLANSRIIGASKGWGFYSDLCDGSLCLSDFLNPLASKVIPLPPLDDMNTCQTEAFYNVAVSSSSACDHDEDLVVAVKFLGRQKLSLCRPNCDMSWTSIVPPFTFMENSNLMYSKRDQRFYLPVPRSNHLCSWDLQGQSFKDHKLLYQNRTKLSQSKHKLFDSCSKAEHWVESPSGERFLVKCYSYVSTSQNREPIFVVYREEETTKRGTIICQTEDIGDLCIFISGTDPFCVEASLCPGLVPNSIYLMESIYGVYDIATRSIRHFGNQVEKPEDYEFDSLPLWLPPTSI
ncbi:unnamed protein product [Arabidopsis halleri]